MKDLIIGILNNVSLFLKERWQAIIAPKETRADKQADVFQKVVSTFHDIQKGDRKDILFHYHMYKEIGVTEEECRSKIKALLEARSSSFMSKKEIVLLLKNINRTTGE